MGDNVMGSFRTNRPPRGRRLGGGRGFRTFRLVRRWFHHESGGIERIAWPLTGSVCSFIVRSIPEGLMFREFSSIWEIQVNTARSRLGKPKARETSCAHVGSVSYSSARARETPRRVIWARPCEIGSGLTLLWPGIRLTCRRRRYPASNPDAPPATR